VTSFYDEVQEIRTRYPEGTRSAILPALRLAQERHGWLSREALEEVADALDLTPAYCYSVASFYDMLHLDPVGTHTIEVCTNICCGLVNAQAVLGERSSASAGRDDRGRRSRCARSSASAAARRPPRPSPPYRQSVTPGTSLDRRGGARG
jgi:hypothetical protein